MAGRVYTVHFPNMKFLVVLGLFLATTPLGVLLMMQEFLKPSFMPGAVGLLILSFALIAKFDKQYGDDLG